MVALVQVENLTKKFGDKTVLQDIHFEIQSGEIVGLLGANGAGKSTLLRILCGLIPATEGQVYIHGKPMTTQVAALKRSIGYLSEQNRLPTTMRVKDFLHLQAQLKRIEKWKKAIEAVTKQCGLHRTILSQRIGMLAKGVQQRVGIANALLGAPSVILLDEPMLGLDTRQVLNLRETLKQIGMHAALIFSSHMLSEVQTICTKLFILNQGRLVANGTFAELHKHDASSRRYRLILSGNDHDFLETLSAIPFPLQCLNVQSLGKRTAFILELLTDRTNFENDFVRWLMEHGYPIQQFTSIEPTLEDLFLKLM
jgi:ABC-2 type transport system ATP-binding protein